MDRPVYKSENDFIWVLSKLNHREVFISLCKEPKTVSELANELNLNYDECSYPIKNLKKRGIIECINPEVRTNKIYSLSEKGEIIAEDLKKHKEYCLANNLREDLYS